MPNENTRSSESGTVKRRSQEGGDVLAPEDWRLRRELHAPDGRKVKASDHVGAIAPDADADVEPAKP
ncbi:MAG: hypothetical protein JWO36_3331 [Myxococcales bacterium]|nr:hypothetical protein [Myxococcales bacterium]